MKTFIFFLGNNLYKECYYQFNDQSRYLTNYTQKAILQKHAGEISRIIVYLTNEARKNNWEGYNKLKDQLLSVNPDIPLHEYDIPNGFSNDQLLSIFSIITDSILPNEQLIIDVTHSFRSLPITLSSVLNYLKQTKNITIEKIYYGAFEVLGNPREVDQIPIENRIAPMLDITYLDTIQQWTVAINNFIYFGNTTALKELSNSAIKPILIETKGRDKTASNIREVVNQLDALMQYIYTCRSLEIIDFNFDNLKQKIEEIIQNNSILPQLTLPFINLKEKFENFNNNNPIKNCILCVEFCLSFNWIQQAYTLLQENFISYLLQLIEENYLDIDNREALKKTINIIHLNIDEKEWDKYLYTKIKKYVSVLNNNPISELFSSYIQLSDLRNDINHAGIKQHFSSPKNLSQKINDIYVKLLQHSSFITI